MESVRETTNGRLPELLPDNHESQSDDASSTHSSLDSGVLSDFSFLDTEEEEQYMDLNLHQQILGAAPNTPDTEDGNSDEMDDTEDMINDDGRPIKRTYQFYNCQTVYMNAFNARGVNINESGNNFPQVTHHGGTVVVRTSNDTLPPYIKEDGPSSASASSSSSSSPFPTAETLNINEYEAQCQASWDQPPQYQDIPSDHTSGSPSTISLLPFRLRRGRSEPPSTPPVAGSSGSHSNNNQLMVGPQANTPLPKFEEGETSGSKFRPLPRTPFPDAPPKSSKVRCLPQTPFLPMDTDPHPNSDFLPPIVEPSSCAIQNAPSTGSTPNKRNGTSQTPLHARKTAPSPKSRRRLPQTPFLQIGTGPLASLEPFPDTVQSAPPNRNAFTANRRRDMPSSSFSETRHYSSPLLTNPSRDPVDNDSKRLGHLLNSALETALSTALIIQTSGTSISSEILSPRADNTLRALNALVSVRETPVSSPSSAGTESVRKVAQWWKFPSSPK